MIKIKAHVGAPLLLIKKLVLAFSDSFHGANACTSTARNALVSVDLKLSIAFAYRVNGALAFAGTTADARITNYICHNYFLLFIWV